MTEGQDDSFKAAERAMVRFAASVEALAAAARVAAEQLSARLPALLAELRGSLAPAGEPGEVVSWCPSRHPSWWVDGKAAPCSASPRCDLANSVAAHQAYWNEVGSPLRIHVNKELNTSWLVSDSDLREMGL